MVAIGDFLSTRVGVCAAAVVAACLQASAALGSMEFQATAQVLGAVDFKPAGDEPITAAISAFDGSAKSTADVYYLEATGNHNGSFVGRYSESINFLERFGLNIGGGVVTVRATYLITSEGPNPGGVSVGLRLTTLGLGGPIIDDVGDLLISGEGGSASGELVATGAFNSALGLRITTNGSSGPGSTSYAEIMVTSITAGGRTIHIPEPATALLLAIGLAALGRRRRPHAAG